MEVENPHSSRAAGEREPFLLGHGRLLAALFLVQVYLASLVLLGWNHGVARGGILAGLLAALIVFRLRPLEPGNPKACADPKRAPPLLVALLAAALVLDLGVAGFTFVRSAQTHRIPLDQGQTTWRAARLLWKGEDPYGFGALVDFYAYTNRAHVRQAEGIATAIPAADVDAALADYDRTLDPAERQRLLPVATARGILGEARLLGYKYGPLPIDMTAIFVPLGIPACVVVLNAIACFGLLWAMYRLMRGARGDAMPALLGALLLLVDPHILWNYLALTATDVWPLLFCSLGVLAFKHGRPLATSAAFALAFCCKIFPSVIFLPLLLQFRSPRPLVVFCGISLAIYAPWLAWDPVGLVGNVFLWPLIVLPDTTAWVYFAPRALAIAVRLAALLAMLAIWFRYLSGRENRLFWTLAVANVLVLGVGSNLHNNYVPWASIWVVAAIVDGFARPAEQGPRAGGEALGALAARPEIGS